MRALELGTKLLSSCEHGWQGRYIETYNLAKAHNLKALISAEAYWVKDRFEKDNTNSHIFIGAMNENGRQALNDVLSEANITGFYGKPRLDIPLLLSLPPEDVVVTTACVAYWKYENIDNITEILANHFKNHFYLEVQYHNTAAQRELNSRILRLHDKLKIPLIMGCDSHFIYPKQAQDRDDFLYSKNIHYKDEEGWYFDYPDGATAYERFAQQAILTHSQICDAMDNTKVFLDVQEYDSPIFNTEIKLPTLYPDLTQEEKDEEYKKLVWAGWDSYKHNVPESQHPYYISEIQKEIQSVVDTKMSDYFIDDYYIVKRGKENGGWLTRSGRGSGVSYITNMLLGFTEVDRIAAKVRMYPERFMSTTRILESGSLPDLDLNVAVVEPFARAQKEILGDDHAYPMIAYGTMKKSAAWKLYAKSQDIPFEIANAVSEQIKKYELAVKHADEDDKDDIDVNDYIGEEFKDIYSKSKDYWGLIASWSIAPCSHLLYQGSIRKEIGLVTIKDNLCCIMDGHWAEAGHFLKNDLLKVRVVEMIYKTFHRLGMDVPSVNQLLKMCPPDDLAWSVYDRGCCLGINQVEKEGTASRVAKYKPKNISEICAFVAAIRPGFKSMYKTFEAREAFEYGCKDFDELIQTEEMPNSFVLYQEQEMAALNYAGIEMSECYTAIKNIAKKRTEKVLAYKEKFIDGFKTAMIAKEGKDEAQATELAHKLWQIIEDSANYSFNASHSYCVAIDSLYGAWLKAHHPLEFYEVYLNLQEDKGDKDKMNAAKTEAESYFDINFPPMRYGQDNRCITAIPESNSITNSIASIKGYSASVGRKLFESSKTTYVSFIDLLHCLDKLGIKAAKYEPLIKIDYFQQFGNQRELFEISRLWGFFSEGSAKSLKRKAVEESGIADIIARHATDTKKDGSPAATYTLKADEIMDCMREGEQRIRAQKMDDLEMKVKVQNSIDILGYVDVVTQKEEDRRRLIITDVTAMKSNGEIWGHRVGTRSLGSGKTARLTVRTDRYNMTPIKAGDIVYATGVYKNPKGYWYLTNYHIE